MPAPNDATNLPMGSNSGTTNGRELSLSTITKLKSGGPMLPTHPDRSSDHDHVHQQTALIASSDTLTNERKDHAHEPTNKKTHNYLRYLVFRKPKGNKKGKNKSKSHEATVYPPLSGAQPQRCEDICGGSENRVPVSEIPLKASLPPGPSSGTLGSPCNRTNVPTPGRTDEARLPQPTFASPSQGQSTIPPNDEPTEAYELSSVSSAAGNGVPPRHLAVCIPDHGIYTRLFEIDVSKMKSDGKILDAIKKVYTAAGKLRWFRTWFRQPISIEFVQFTVWQKLEGFVSIIDRPRSVPPENHQMYDFTPDLIGAMPPVPSERIIHHLRHKKHDRNANRNILIKRLPKRIGDSVNACPIPTYAWGIYIREGHRRRLFLWTIMLGVIISVCFGFFWSGLRHDMQGGSGMGSMLLAMLTTIMAAFAFLYSDDG